MEVEPQAACAVESCGDCPLHRAPIGDTPDRGHVDGDLRTIARTSWSRSRSSNTRNAASGRLADDAVAALRRQFDEASTAAGKLRALWALHVTNRLPPERLLALIDHPMPAVRGLAAQKHDSLALGDLTAMTLSTIGLGAILATSATLFTALSGETVHLGANLQAKLLAAATVKARSITMVMMRRLIEPGGIEPRKETAKPMRKLTRMNVMSPFR